MKQLIITPEEMAEIRRRFEILRRGHPITGSFSLGVHMDGYLRNYAHGFEVNFISLLTALEQAESRAEKAEVEVVRLTKERDWLANQLYCPPEFTNCALDCAECRKEAARRAVADAESEVE